MADNLENDAILSKSAKEAVLAWDSGKLEEETFRNTVKKHRVEIRHKYLWMISIALATAVLGLFSVTIGSTDVGFFETFEIIWDRITGNVVDPVLDFLVVDYRLPRVIAAIITGCGLAICGAVMQSVLKNPLADPYTTGVSSGAAFGATLAMTLGLAGYAGGFGLVIIAFVCAMVPIAVIATMAKATNASPTTMIMAGIGVMYIFNAFTTMIMLWSDPKDLANIYRWQVGSLAMISSWDNIPVMLIIVTAGTTLMCILSEKLNVLATGDESAKSMGVDADRMRLITLVVTGVIAAGVVSFTGLIGFVGLVAPHIMRIFMGADNRYLLPASALFGSLLLLLADTIGKAGICDIVVQTGVVMALIGGPVFLWLILRRNSNLW